MTISHEDSERRNMQAVSPQSGSDKSPTPTGDVMRYALLPIAGISFASLVILLLCVMLYPGASGLDGKLMMPFEFFFLMGLGLCMFLALHVTVAVLRKDDLEARRRAMGHITTGFVVSLATAAIIGATAFLAMRWYSDGASQEAEAAEGADAGSDDVTEEEIPDDQAQEIIDG